MRKFKKLGVAFVLSLSLAMTVPTVLPGAGETITAEAAIVKINKPKATIIVGKTILLKMIGTKSKATWKSSNQKIAVVDKNGKVTGKKAGKATITAMVNKKQYTCVITVKAAPKPTPTSMPNKEGNGSADIGTLEGTTYKDKTYGFSITVPEDYVIYDKETSLAFMYLTIGGLFDSADEMMEALDSVGISYPFVALTTKPLSENATANIITQSFPSSVMPGTLKEVVSQTVEASAKLYKPIGVEPTIKKPEIIKVGGKDICVAESNIYLDGDYAGVTYTDFTLNQKIICFDSGDNRILISCTYHTKEEGKAIEAMLKTIKITK